MPVIKNRIYRQFIKPFVKACIIINYKLLKGEAHF